MFGKLSKRQLAVYDFVADAIFKEERSPSIAEIAEACDVRSHRAVIVALGTLEKRGFIFREPVTGVIRLRWPRSPVVIPVLGKVR